VTTHRSLHPSFGPGRPALGFEPIVTLADGDVRAHEAVITTDAPVGFGVTRGGAFEYVLGKVAAHLARQAPGAAVAFNVTLDQLLDERLPSLVGEIAERAGVEPHAFLFEIDATLAETDPSGTRSAIERLHEDAWSVTLDRIDAARSPLRTLAVLPVDMVKIDQNTVHDADRDRLEDLTAVVATARWLGIGTIATGISDLPELAAAIAHGYDLAQGPIFGEQLPTSRLRGEATGPAL